MFIQIQPTPASTAPQITSSPLIVPIINTLYAMDVRKPMFHSRAHIETGDIVILYMVRFHLFELGLSSGS